MPIRSNFSRATLNGIIMWVVLAVVGLVPFALGGNRPMVWTLTLIVLAIAGLLYFMTIAALDVNLAADGAALRRRTILLAAFLAFICLQLLPIAAILPNFLVWLPQGIPAPSTISTSAPDTLLNLICWLNIAFIGFFSIQAGANDSRARKLLAYLFWLAVAHALLAFLMFYEFDDAILFMPKWAYEGSMTGPFVNRNTFGTFLASAAALGVSMMGRALTTPRRSRWELLSVQGGLILPAIGVTIILVALVSSTSRMGLFVGVAGIVTVLILGVLKQARGSRSIGSTVLMALLAFCGVGLLVVLYGATTLERLGSVDSSADYRIDLYRQVLSMIAARPLTGFGGGTFELAFPLFHELPVSTDLIWQKAHNTYLAYLADYGIVFGSLPILIVIFTLYELFRVYWKSNTSDYTVIATIAVIIVAGLHALVDFSLEIQGYALYFAAIFGVGVARTITTRLAEK